LPVILITPIFPQKNKSTTIISMDKRHYNVATLDKFDGYDC